MNLAFGELQTKQSIDKTTPFRDGQIIRAQNANYLVLDGQVLQIDEASPSAITKEQVMHAQKVAADAKNIVVNAGQVVLVDQSGRAYQTTEDNFRYNENLQPISDTGKVVISANITPNSQVGVLYNTGEVGLIEPNSSQVLSKYRIEELPKNVSTSNFQISFTNKNWIVHYQDLDNKNCKLWINGKLQPEYTTPVKLAPPSKQDTLYFQATTGIYEMDKTAEVKKLKLFNTAEHTPAAIEVVDGGSVQAQTQEITKLVEKLWRSGKLQLNLFLQHVYREQQVVPFSAHQIR